MMITNIRVLSNVSYTLVDLLNKDLDRDGVNYIEDKFDANDALKNWIGLWNEKDTDDSSGEEENVTAEKREVS